MTKKTSSKLDKLIAAQAKRLKDKRTGKSVAVATSQLSADMDKIVRDLHSVKTILACLCFQQDDLSIEIPVSVVEKLPKGTELEIGFNHDSQCYVFKAIPPKEDAGEPAQQTGLIHTL